MDHSVGVIGRQIRHLSVPGEATLLFSTCDGYSNPVKYTDPSGLSSLPQSPGFVSFGSSISHLLHIVYTLHLSDCDPLLSSLSSPESGLGQSHHFQGDSACLGGFCRLAGIDWLSGGQSAGIRLDAAASNDQSVYVNYGKTTFALYIALDMIYLAAQDLSIDDVIRKVAGNHSVLTINMPSSSSCPIGKAEDWAEYNSGGINLYGSGTDNCWLSDKGIETIIHEMGHGLDEWMTYFVDQTFRYRTGTAYFPHGNGLTRYSETLWASTRDWECVVAARCSGYVPIPRDSGQFVSPYARNGPREDFAETFAAAVIDYNRLPDGSPVIHSAYIPVPGKFKSILTLLRMQWRGY